MPWSSQPIRGNIAYLVYGDVTVDETAAIAPGVLLQADPGSRLVIAAGVSIGMGAILHANQGTLEIGTEVVIGASVLIIGNGTVGDRACIGASSTLFNCSVAAAQVIAAHTVLQGIDDDERLAGRDAENEATGRRDDRAGDDKTGDDKTGDRPADTPISPDASHSQNGAASSPLSVDSPSRSHVYGFTQFEQLVTSLFPHRQALAPAPAPEGTPPESTA